MPRQLTRDTRQAMVGGIAAGFARYFNVDPVVARLAFVFLAFLHGAGVVLYLVCWVVMPVAREGDGAAEGREGAPPPVEGTEAGGGSTEEAPADRFVKEVREAGERVVGGLRQRADEPWRGQIVGGAILVGIGLMLLIQRLDLWFWPDWLNIWDLWPAVLIVAGAAMLSRARSSAP